MKNGSLWATACAAVLVAASCTDEGEADTMNATGGSGPSTGSAGASAPEGGGGAAGGAGGQGGEGGGSSGCLAEDVAEGFFTIADPALCIVEVLTADDLVLAGYGAAPTWGLHGGPLTFEPTATGVTIQRWSATAGALEATTEDVAVPDAPANAFWGTIAVEHPTPAGDPCGAGSAIAVAWSGQDFFNQGAIVRVAGGSSSSQLATGVFGMASVGGRLFYTGLSEVGGAPVGELALYVADAQPTCDADGFASAGSADTWGLATGPVAVDGDDNVFAIMTDYITETQEIRAFVAADTSAPGTPVATLPGFGDALAAIAPLGAEPGLVVLQPNATDFSHGEVLAIEFTIAGGALTASAPKTLLDVTLTDDNVALFTDDTGRLWVGLTRDTTTTFFVMERAPAD